MDNKVLAVIITVIGALGTIFGRVDPIKSLLPEPDIFYGLDTSQEIFDHSLSPNQMKFHLIHNGTDTFYIHGLLRQEELPQIPLLLGFHQLPKLVFYNHLL